MSQERGSGRAAVAVAAVAASARRRAAGTEGVMDGRAPPANTFIDGCDTVGGQPWWGGSLSRPGR